MPYRIQHINRILWLMLFLSVRASAQSLHHPALLIEAEDFQFRGGWEINADETHTASGNKILSVKSGKEPAADALTVFQVPQAGTYTIWTHSRDYASNKPGTRLYRLHVNEQPMDKESGAHGKEGFYWEKAGTAKLDAGESLLRLKDTRNQFARCDAILLTLSATLDPNSLPVEQLTVFKINPLKVVTDKMSFSFKTAATISKKSTTLASIGNEKTRLNIVALNDAAKTIVTKMSCFNGKEWVSVNPATEDNRIYLLRSINPQLSTTSYFPSWNGSLNTTRFTTNGKTYTVLEPDNARNPFYSGELLLCRIEKVTRLSASQLQVTYQTNEGETITGSWQINTNSNHRTLILQYTVAKAGYYSFVVTAGQPASAERVQEVQLSPMFQYQRIPEQPILLPGALTPQPVAIVETRQDQQQLSLFVTGSPGGFPLDWVSNSTSRIGFSLKNERNEVQPVAFAPVPGLADSKLAPGQTLQRSFETGMMTAGWNEALAYVSSGIFKVADYRSQENTSLTTAAFNIIDLLKNDTASGWSPELKGFYDIEGDPAVAPTVAQSSPLTVVAAAVLTNDETFYIRRALPTIEYSLSRSGFRWAKAMGSPHIRDRSVLELSPWGQQFNTAYFEGLHRLLNNANPWLTDIALPNKQPRIPKGYSVEIPAWTQQLAAYRLTGDPYWLNQSINHAKQFLQQDVYGKKNKHLTIDPFYNTSFYPYWWDLMDLHEAISSQSNRLKQPDSLFLKAAEYAAFYTIAGLRSFPSVKDSVQTIHPGNVYNGNTTMWWKGGQRYRLGFPRVAGDAKEKTVQQQLVSPVGLGLEQPITFFQADGRPVRHIFMSNWAPHLLRLYQYNNRELFKVYARNSIIGRFSNYPGYYATGFTDITMQPDFPYKGPDVSSIYYHHIPPHLSFTLDYLVTEAIQRSSGKVSFPWGKQEGFVWFNNRVYGAGKGQVLDDQGVKLWMKKGLVTIDRPEVNYITGISDNRFWIILLNESTNELPVIVQLGKEAPAASEALFYDGLETKPKTVAISERSATVVLQPKGFAALAMTLTTGHPRPPEPQPVTNGMKVIDLGEPWGKCYAFRIRSPFGWDSFYAYLGTPPLDNATATMILNDQPEKNNKKTGYPYEWTFLRIDPKAPAMLELELQAGNGQPKKVRISFE